MTFRPVCDAPGCSRPATHHIARRWKVCALHTDMARIGVRTAAKSAAVAAAPALTRRFPKLVTAAKLFMTARAKFDEARARADHDRDRDVEVIEAEVIEATVIRTERTAS